MSDKGGDFLCGFLIGGVAGAVLALLYAPKSGKETRADLGRRAEDLIATARDDYEKALERSKKTYEAAIQRLKDLESAAKDKMEHIEEEVSEITDRGAEALQDGKSRLKRAINAGVEAFKEEKTS